LSILSDFEDRIGRALEGSFARVFRSPVQPAELARKLSKEMDRGKKLGVGKVYAPTLYNVLLSRQDDAALGGFAETLAGELETYLVGYARERNYQLSTRPVVRFLVDKDLKLGRFDVIGELLSPEELAEELGYSPDEEQFETPREPAHREPGRAAGAAAIAATPEPQAEPEPEAGPSIFDADALDLDFGAAAVGAAAAAAPPAPERAPEPAPAPLPAESSPTALLEPAEEYATVTVPGSDRDFALKGARAVVGRIAKCDICIADVNVSREHAAFEREGTGWAVRDLGSTNGTLVNGVRVSRQRLKNGDTIGIGVTELTYHEPRR